MDEEGARALMQRQDVKEDEDEVNDEAEELDNMEREDGYIFAGQRRLIKNRDGKGMARRLAHVEIYSLPLSRWHKQVVTISKFMQLETSQGRFTQSQWILRIRPT